MKTYFGFAIAPSMFPDHCEISKRTISPEIAKSEVEASASIGNLVVCLNPSHKATIEAMGERFGLVVPIPPAAPSVALSRGDQIIVLSVNLPRLPEGRREYTPEEVAAAKFTFAIFDVH